MGSVCAEQQHKFHHSHQLYLNKKSLREIEIPPRKLLGRRSAGSPEMYVDSPKGEDSAFSKFLPYNDVDDSDPYSSDHFRMYEFKVRKCNRSRSHDWTDCPFAHPGEKARRRDPRRFHYSGNVCSEFRKGNCGKGDNCEFAHGVFECWLHPSRYRTEACKDGKNCKRKVCFFAHSTRQLRMLPETSPSPPLDSPPAEKRYRNFNNNNCCVFCHTMNASPTSTLMGMSRGSPPLSPPISPMCSSEFAPYGNRFNAAGMRYKEALNELMASFDAMNVNVIQDVNLQSPVNGGMNLPWLDVNFSPDDQSKFTLSPSLPSPPNLSHVPGKFIAGDSKLYPGEFSGRDCMEDGWRYNGENNLGGPDLGWVNDLLT